MKNILVPTDFSACAANALNTGVALAKNFKAQLHLLTKIDLPNNWEKMTPKEREAFPEALQEIENTRILQANITAKHPDVITKTYITGGNLINAINQYIKLNAIDFMVMGSHGASGKNEYFVGSNTQKVVRTIHCPVLVVKDKFENLNFDKVIFASGFNERDKQAFLHFKDFIKHFIPEVHLVAIHTASIFDPPYILSKEAMENFKQLCHPLTCYTHVYRDFTKERGIRSFANEIGADLIGISNHFRHPLKRMLTGSTVEAIINHSGLPVLSVDYAEQAVLIDKK